MQPYNADHDVIQNFEIRRNFSLYEFENLGRLEKHAYADAFLDKKIKLTYIDAIDQFVQLLSREKKLAIAYENSINFKKNFSKISLDENYLLKDYLLSAVVDKFNGTFHLIMKKQNENAISFYEFDSTIEELKYHGDVLFDISEKKIVSILENQSYKIVYQAECRFGMKQMWENATFSVMHKDLSKEQLLSRFPEHGYYIENPRRATQPNLPFVEQYFQNIHEMPKYLQPRHIYDNLDSNRISNQDHHETIISIFSAAHSRLKTEDVFEKWSQTNQKKIKNARSIQL